MKLIFTILTVFLCSSQIYAQNQNLSKEGVSLSWEADWELTEQDSLDGAGFYLALEKSGMDESGLVTITWFHSDVPEETFLVILQDEFYKNYDENSDLVFSEIYDSKFAGINCKASDFEFSLFGLEHNGTIFSFRTQGKSFAILKQEATEDTAKNSSGFKSIESNFKVN